MVNSTQMPAAYTCNFAFNLNYKKIIKKRAQTFTALCIISEFISYLYKILKMFETTVSHLMMYAHDHQKSIEHYAFYSTSSVFEVQNIVNDFDHHIFIEDTTV